MLSGADVRRIREYRHFSQQELARHSGVNKAYISEYESGVRPELPAAMLERLEKFLLDTAPAGRISARLMPREKDGRTRLQLIDGEGNEYWPRDASVQWVEEDGSSYALFVGESDAD